MATTTPATGGLTMPLERIHVSENVRALNAEHVSALAASIALQGMLVPIVVYPRTGRNRRDRLRVRARRRVPPHRGCGKLGLVEVSVVIRDNAGEQADRRCSTRA